MFDVCLITFSPTGSSLRVAQAIANGVGGKIQTIDLTAPRLHTRVCQSSLAIIAMPVYAGRVPALAVERLREISSRGAKAVTVVVYGNRAYEDALLELNDEAADLGFEIVASAAVVAQHSVVGSLATGRPDTDDLESLRVFGQTVKTGIDAGEIHSVVVPGNRPYRDPMTVSVTPLVGDACTGCRLCVTQCPTQAISMLDPKYTDLSKCLMCMRCVSVCPARARSLPDAMQKAMAEKLSPFASVRRENEFF